MSPADASAPAPPRVIVHMDLDTFFVSVERLKNPALNGLPVLVGGHGDRGVVASCSYEARAFGIHAGMPIAQARRLCPQAVVTPGDYTSYVEFSRRVRDIAAAAPVLEFASIDEFYMDLTGMDRHFHAWSFAQELRQRIMRLTKLPLSMGMACTKAVAKIATGTAKPCGERWIKPGEERSFLAPLPIAKIPGAGPETCKRLAERGLTHIHHLQALPEDTLDTWLGQMGTSVWRKANARDTAPVIPDWERKQIGCEETFDADTANPTALLALLTRMTEQLAYQLRAKGKLTACVTIKIRYTDFSTPTRQQRIPPTAQDETLLDIVRQLFQAHYQPGRKVRLVGVSLSHLVPGGVQLNLLTDTVARTHLMQATDKIRSRYGAGAIHRATTLNACGRGRSYRDPTSGPNFQPPDGR